MLGVLLSIAVGSGGFVVGRGLGGAVGSIVSVGLSSIVIWRVLGGTAHIPPVADVPPMVPTVPPAAEVPTEIPTVDASDPSPAIPPPWWVP